MSKAATLVVFVEILRKREQEAIARGDQPTTKSAQTILRRIVQDLASEVRKGHNFCDDLDCPTCLACNTLEAWDIANQEDLEQALLIAKAL